MAPPRPTVAQPTDRRAVRTRCGLRFNLSVDNKCVCVSVSNKCVTSVCVCLCSVSNKCVCVCNTFVRVLKFQRGASVWGCRQLTWFEHKLLYTVVT